MPAQAYSPFRAGLITPQDLRALNEIKSWIPVLATLVHWALIVAAWTMVARWPSLATAALAFVVVGVNFYGLFIIMHDGLHRRLFRSVAINDLWNDLTMTASIGAITRINRRNHMTHHHSTCLAEDPDRFKYLHEGKDVVVPFVAFLSGLSPLATAVKNVFFKPARKSAAPVSTEALEPSERYRARDLLLLAVWQIALIGGLSHAIGWWAYPCLWLAPIYVFAYRADLVRVFCEHSMMVADDDADHSMRLVTYRSNWLEKLFFAPHNMNYHMAHHLWPSIPYYNLPEADRLIRASEIASSDSRLVWRKSYVGYLIAYARWRWHSTGVITAEQSHA